MARSRKDFDGWEIQFEEPQDSTGPLTPRGTRRTRRTLLDISITRQTDDLKIRCGDFVLARGKDGTDLYLVRDILHGGVRYVDLVGYRLLLGRDIHATEGTCDPNEVLLTAYLAGIDVADIVERATVISQSEFKDEIVLDETNSFNTFFCRRGCAIDGTNVSDEFDFPEFLGLFRTDKVLFHDELKQLTVKTAYKETPRASPKRPLSRKPTPKPGKIVKDETPELSESSEDEFDEKSSDLESDEELVAEKATPTSTPRKRGRTPKSTPRKEKDKSREYMNSVLLPLKKRLKLKKDNAPSLEALSPSKKSSYTPELIDTSSRAFQDLKAKLHTSAKVASLPCREEEFTAIYLNLESAIQDRSGCCVYVSGTPGVGKTATIREVIHQLRDLVDVNELPDFDYVEINGLKLLNPNAAYEQLWERLSGYKVSATNSALLLENYFSEPNDRKPLVILMDELDQLATKKQNVMYNFFNWPTYEHSHLIVIAVANTMDLPERLLSNKISSRLGLRRIQFVGYTYEQLGTIIRHRLDMLTKENKRKVVIDTDAVGFASRKVASVSGDARRALAICRRAVEVAEQEYLATALATDLNLVVEDQSYRVQIHHISRAINETVSSPVAQFLASLPFGSKLVLRALLLRMLRTGLGEIKLGDVIDEMRNLLVLLTGKHTFDAAISDGGGVADFFYGSGALDSRDHGKPTNLRIPHFSCIITELTECGVLTGQISQSERDRLVSLNVSEDEVKSALSKDPDIAAMAAIT